MRYLYRSYCLKEGGIWSGRLRAWRWKSKLLNQSENLIEKSREQMLQDTSTIRTVCELRSDESGRGRRVGEGVKWDRELHGWTHISLRYLHILAKEYYKAGTERALPISWRRAEHPPPPQASARATGRWVSWGWPACRTSGAAPSPSC